MTKTVKCDYCGRKVPKNKTTYVEGRRYCRECVSEAEIYADADVFDDDDEEEDEDDYDEDEDEDEDDYDD